MTKILIMYSTERPTAGHVDRLEKLVGAGNVNVALSEEDAKKLSVDAEIILGHRYLWQSLPGAKKIKWVQATAAGVDALLTPVFYEKNPLLSRMPIFSKHIAVHGFSMMLSLSQRLVESSFYSGRGDLPSKLIPFSTPKKAVIFGMGGIGFELGRLLQSFGCHVIGVRRHIPDGNFSCDQWKGIDDWEEALADTDVLFSTAPLTNQTQGMFDVNLLSKLPDNAIFINLGRGRLVNHSALVHLLEKGQLAGVGLDVIDGASDEEKEQLLNFPNLVYTPKTSSLFAERQNQLEEFVESQVCRYLQGEKILHLVNL